MVAGFGGKVRAKALKRYLVSPYLFRFVFLNFRYANEIYNRLNYISIVYCRNIQLWGKLKIMGWVVKFTVSVSPGYCRLSEAL